MLWTLAEMASEARRDDLAEKFRGAAVDQFSRALGASAMILAEAHPPMAAGVLAELRAELLRAKRGADVVADARRALRYIQWRRGAPAAAVERIEREMGIHDLEGGDG